MSSYHALRVGVVAVIVVALLAFAATPVQALPAHPSPAKAVHVAGVGERLEHLLAGLWTRIFQEEGMSIDPNGAQNGQGTTASPNPPDLPDEGVTIDPNGHQ
ncbi:MAG TPA: hypothetical protein VIA62_13765 [Thermoanaerobaculia bacterium]|jgi:hypothetical protein|nr:hypothetical protein [Thermoanaerobaculia bacterium]